MSLRVSLATAYRVLTQLRRDPRTIALVLLAPAVIITLVKYLLQGRPEAFERVGGPALGLFPFIQMFLITSIAVLRERTTGTLERLMAMPVAKLDFLVGYAVAFALLAGMQVGVVSAVAFLVLDLELAGSVWLVMALAVASALVGVSIGLLLSAFAANEFQASEFMPAFILPQLLLCGLLVPRSQMAGWLQRIADVMPLTYAYDAIDRVARGEDLGKSLLVDLAVVAGTTVVGLSLGAATLRRRTP